MFGNPKAPISTPYLARRAFFSEQFPECDHPDMNRVFNELESSESLIWPFVLTFPFADTNIINQNIHERIAIIGGQEDKLMTPEIIIATGEKYNKQSTIIENSGHDIMLDINWKASAKLIVDIIILWSDI